MISARAWQKIAVSALWVSGLLILAALILIVGYVLMGGAGMLNLHFLLGASEGTGRGGIFPMIVSTVYSTGLALLVAVPLGVGGGIYLAEYATDSPIVKTIRLMIETLAGAPTIVVGLFGLAFFILYFRLPSSLLAVGLTLSILALPLVVTEHHKLRYLQDWREGRLKIGEITISTFKDRANVFVPFKREVEPKPVEGICGIDINERSVDMTILKPGEQPEHISLDISKLPAIRHSSQLKRKSIQEKLDALPRRPVQKRRLRGKYWRRERNRTNQILHITSKQIAEIAERERVAVAFEGIKNIRKSMRSKRKSKNGRTLQKDMRRRLNQWPFRKLQFYTNYKVARQGLPTVEVSNYHKSKDCPICGRYNRPNGHAYRCQTCGFEASRHLAASWNIAKDGARHVPADCWQMQRAAEELVAPAKLSAEPEKIPCQAGIRFATEF